MTMQPTLLPVSPASELLSDILLSDIDADPENERQDLCANLGDLISSLRTFGLQERVRLYALSNGRYLIASGHRRVAAARTLHWRLIPAIVTSPPTEAIEHIVSRLASNLCRKDIDPISLAQSLSALRNHYSVPLSEIAHWLGKSPTSVTNHLRLLDLPSAIQDILRSGALSVSHALLLLRIQSAELDWSGQAIATAEECQLRLATAAVDENLSIRALEVRVRNIIGNNHAIHEWLAKQSQRPASKHSTADSTPVPTSIQHTTVLESETSDRYHQQRLIARTAIQQALDFHDDLGPTLDHLRLAAMLLADSIYFYHSPVNVGLPDHGEMIRHIERSPTPSALLNILGRLANAAILDDLNIDGTDLLGNGRSRWAKSRFDLLPAIHQALRALDEPHR